MLQGAKGVYMSTVPVSKYTHAYIWIYMHVHIHTYVTALQACCEQLLIEIPFCYWRVIECHYVIKFRIVAFCSTHFLLLDFRFFTGGDYRVARWNAIDCKWWICVKSCETKRFGFMLWYISQCVNDWWI